MKKIILFLCFLGIIGNITAQSTINFAARFNIQTALGGDPYTLSGVIVDDFNKFAALNVQVNDSIYVIDNGELYILAVTAISSASGQLITLTADDPLNAGISISTGVAAIMRPTAIAKYPTYVSGLPDDLQSLIMNRQIQMIDNYAATSGDITDFTTAGLGNPPAASPSGKAGETWRNMTTGELWRSDGTNWIAGTNTLAATQVGRGNGIGNPLISNNNFIANDTVVGVRKNGGTLNGMFSIGDSTVSARDGQFVFDILRNGALNSLTNLVKITDTAVINRVNIAGANHQWLGPGTGGGSRMNLFDNGTIVLGRPGSSADIQLNSGTPGSIWSIQTGAFTSPGGTVDETIRFGMNIPGSTSYTTSKNSLRYEIETNFTDPGIWKYDEYYLQWTPKSTGAGAWNTTNNSWRNFYTVFNEIGDTAHIETAFAGEITFRPTSSFTTFSGAPVSLMLEESGHILMGARPQYNVAKLDIVYDNVKYPTLSLGTNSSGVAPRVSFYLFNSDSLSRPEYSTIRMVGIDATKRSEDGSLAFHTIRNGTLNPRMIILNTPRVGINTISPFESLTVVDSSFSTTHTSTGISVVAPLGGFVGDASGYGIRQVAGNTLVRYLARVNNGAYSADIDVISGGVPKPRLKIYDSGRIAMPALPVRVAETNIAYINSADTSLAWGPLTLNVLPPGSVSGQIIKWNGSAWALSTDAVSSLPSGEFGYGTGTGITSISNFTTNGTTAAFGNSGVAATSRLDVYFENTAIPNPIPTMMVGSGGSDLQSDIGFYYKNGSAKPAYARIAMTAIGGGLGIETGQLDIIVRNSGTEGTVATFKPSGAVQFPSLPARVAQTNIVYGDGTNNLAIGPLVASVIAQSGATPGQALIWNGSTWAASSSGLVPTGSNTQTLRNSSGTWVANSTITNDGATVGINTAPATTGRLSVLTNNAGTMPALYFEGYENNVGSYTGMRFNFGITAGAANAAIAFKANGTDVVGIGLQSATASSGNLILSTRIANVLAEKARLDSVGNLVLGTNIAARRLHVYHNDAVTNAVTFGERITHKSTGTAAIGFGSGMEYELENASNVDKVAFTENVTWSDPVNATEDATYTLNLMRAGTLATALTVNSLGNVGIGTITPAAKIDIVNSSTVTTGSVLDESINGSYAATSGNAIYRSLNMAYTINNVGTPVTGSATGIFLNASETALNGMTHNLVTLQTDGTTRININNTGGILSQYTKFGAGSPEGVVTAPVGSIYSRTDGSAGTSMYIKESGAGSAGWTAMSTSIGLQGLQSVTSIGRYTTNSMRSDSFLEVRHTDAIALQSFRMTNPTVSTGVTWDWRNRNNGILELKSSGIGAWTAKFQTNNLFVRGQVISGPAIISVAPTGTDALVAGVDSLAGASSIAAINTMPNAAADAVVKAITQTSGGDAKFVMYHGNSALGYFGGDASDGNKVKMGTGGIPGTNTHLTLESYGTYFNRALYYNVVGSSGTTYQIPGTESIYWVTGSTTTITLPEIVASSPGANQVTTGYQLRLANPTGSSVTINRSGSDLIWSLTTITLLTEAEVVLTAIGPNLWSTK